MIILTLSSTVKEMINFNPFPSCKILMILLTLFSLTDSNLTELPVKNVKYDKYNPFGHSKNFISVTLSLKVHKMYEQLKPFPLKLM